MSSPNLIKKNIVIDGMAINLPISTEKDSVLSPFTTFEKPSWMPDIEANACLHCSTRFTHFRRKHHCRNCGKIFCSKCCLGKVSLPHFGMDNPEKVCFDCEMIVTLMEKSRSPNTSEKFEAITGLSSLLKNAAGLAKVIECGGVHMMMSISTQGDLKLKAAVASALHNVAQNMVLNHFLVSAGCLKVLKEFLNSSADCTDLLNNSLSTLNLLCMDVALRLEVLKEGLIDPLLSIINSLSGIVSVFACRVLQLLVCNFEYHEFILKKHPKLVSELFDCLRNEDYQMLGSLSKMLMYMSAGSEALRRIIIEEEMKREFPFVYLLKGSSQGILINVSCIVANLSLILHENFVPNYIQALSDLLPLVDDDNSELLSQVGRGLANFAEFPSNALHMVQHLPIITSKLLKSPFEVPRVHACRTIMYLISSEPSCALESLSQSGMDEFICTVFELPGLTDILNNLFLRKVSRLSVCQQQT